MIRSFTTLQRAASLKSQVLFAVLSILLFASTGCSPATGDGSSRKRITLAIAAASDLQPLLPAIVDDFCRRSTEIEATLTFGASGMLAEQIKQGAPFDVFLSADESFVDGLVAAGIGDAATTTHYADGVLALWQRRRKDSDEIGASIAHLANAGEIRIALANPAHAPYGRAAEQCLRRSGVWDRLTSRLVLAANVAQAAQYSASGDVDAAFVSMTSAKSGAFPKDGTIERVSAALYDPLKQTGVAVKRAGGNLVARRFLQHLLTSDVQRRLGEAGLERVRH